MLPSLNINGVTLMESNNNNNTCISSTLTFNGSLSALTQLNSATLFCGVGLNKVNMSITVPSKLMRTFYIKLLFCCHNIMS